MPKDLTEKLVWLFLLLPGFLSMSLVGVMVELGQLSEFQITFYSLILTLVNATIALGVCWLLLKVLRRVNRAAFSGSAIYYLFFGVAVTVSIILGLLLGLAAEKDTFFVALRALPISDALNKRSSSRPMVFLLSQNSGGKLKSEGDARPKGLKQTEAWALVHMKNGRSFEGWPEFYETGSKPTEVYLSPACEATLASAKSGEVASVRPIRGPGVILYESEIQSVELLDRAASLCFANWYGEPKKKVESEERISK